MKRARLAGVQRWWSIQWTAVATVSVAVAKRPQLSGGAQGQAHSNACPLQTTPARRRLARRPSGVNGQGGIWRVLASVLGADLVEASRITGSKICWLFAKLWVNSSPFWTTVVVCAGSNLVHNLGRPMRSGAHPFADQTTQGQTIESPSAAGRLQSSNSAVGRPPAWRGARVAGHARGACATRPRSAAQRRPHGRNRGRSWTEPAATTTAACRLRRGAPRPSTRPHSDGVGLVDARRWAGRRSTARAVTRARHDAFTREGAPASGALVGYDSGVERPRHP